MKKRLFIFGVCLCVAGRLIAQDVHFIMQHKKTAMKSSVHGSKGIPLKLKTNLLYDALHVPNLSAELGLGRNMSIGDWITGIPGLTAIRHTTTGEVMVAV